MQKCFCSYSLYPTVLKYSEFPVAHPEIITENFKEVIPNRRFPYFGIIKCTVVPPRQLYHPVLPFSCNGKLLFPLCRTCAERKNEEYCSHSKEERALTSTWVTVELEKALSKGYEVRIFIYEMQIFISTDKKGGLWPPLNIEKLIHSGCFTQKISMNATKVCSKNDEKLHEVFRGFLK